MHVGPNGLLLVEHTESTVLRVYLDSRGLPTAGTGHLLTEADGPYQVGDPITQAQNDAWLEADLGAAEAAVAGCGLDLTQNQFDALVDFAFNEGAGNLAELVENANGSLSVIADHFSHYTRSGHDHPRGLKIRRLLERDLFLTPDDVPMADGWLTAHDGVA